MSTTTAPGRPALTSGDLATVIAALEEAAEDRTERASGYRSCAECAWTVVRCEDHAGHAARAAEYGSLAERLAGGA
jgi:hypothetical protein